MAGFADSCLRPDMDENKIRLPISPAKPADVASLYAISSTILETAKNDDEEFKKADQSHGEVLETSWKLISRKNRSTENASIEQDVSRYQTCNSVIALQGDKNDAYCTRSNHRCGIHEDLLFDIMLWLPVISLLRFRSVCKLWRSLIDSSTFITQHYNHNSNKNCLLVHHKLSSYGSDFGSKFCLLSGNKYEVYSDLDYKQPWYSVSEIIFLNSCNGIVCLSNGKFGNVALWNPATKQLRSLPESSTTSITNVKYGFGFDAKSNDYKVVKICYSYEKKHSYLVEVYSLRTDSWRIIHKADVLPSKYIHSYVTKCKNGTCFWIGKTYYDPFSSFLVSFDLNNEVFETILPPGEHGPDSWDDTCTHLDILNDKLCYVKGMTLDPYRELYFEIWTLDECGVKESWNKICKLKISGGLEWDPRVLGFSKNGEFLLLGYKYGPADLYLSNFGAREEYYNTTNGAWTMSHKKLQVQVWVA